MKLEPSATGIWYIHVKGSESETPIRVKIYARDTNGSPRANPTPELIAAAEITKTNAQRLRDDFIREIECPDSDEVFAYAEDLPAPGFTKEELINPNNDVIQRLKSMVQLLHISVEQYPNGLIETRGYVADAWSRIWEVGNDYIEGPFQIDEFQP